MTGTAYRRAQRDAQQSTTNDPNLLQRKAREWAEAVVNLHNTPVPSQFEGDKKRLLNYAKTVKNVVESAIGTIPQLDPLNQLGAIPVVIGVIGVGAASAAIVKWYTDYAKFKEKINLYNTLRKEGNNAQVSTNLTNSITNQPSILKSVFSDTKKIAMLGVAGFLGLTLLKKRGFF